VQPPSRVIDALGVALDSLVLELGCGPGYFSPALTTALPQGRAVLGDLQRPMLELARDRTSMSGRASVVQLDAASLPFGSGRFDAVLVVLMLGEVPDRQRCLAESRRVLRPGGAAVFAESRRDGDFIRRSELQALVEPVGFRLDHTRGWFWEYTARFRAV
jgi:ubiquinone/menaquinone biosynthesis C-methylase UbiE